MLTKQMVIRYEDKLITSKWCHFTILKTANAKKEITFQFQPSKQLPFNKAVDILRS